MKAQAVFNLLAELKKAKYDWTIDDNAHTLTRWTIEIGNLKHCWLKVEEQKLTLQNKTTDLLFYINLKQLPHLIINFNLNCLVLDFKKEDK